MKFKVLCDVHIAFKVVKYFQGKGYDAIHVNDILDGYYTKDSVISEYADELEYVVMSKDADFRYSHFLQGKPERLLHITLGNIATGELIDILDHNLDMLVDNFNSGKCFIELGKDYLKIID